MREIKEVIIHCSDTDGGNAAAIRRFHMAPPPQGRGWSDIGYHYVIDQDGTIESGRKEDVVGAHCEGHNAHSLGICLIGKESFNALQFNALGKLLKSILDHHGLTEANINCHNFYDTAIVQGKTCPNIPIENIRNLLKETV
jgi:hypothetical protein